MPGIAPTAPSPQAIRDVDVWLVDLATDSGLDASLDRAEREHATRLRTAELRRRYVVRRAARRHIVAAYLGLPPAEVTFRHGPNGKPEPAEADGWHLSCSHRADLGVVGICAGAPLGVDIEAVHEPADLDVAQVMLSPAEHAEFRELPQAQRSIALLTAWTRKEAVVKALGVGLSLPLSTFDVPVDPAVPPRLLAQRGAARDSRLWAMADLPLPPGYVGTVMTQGRRCRVHVQTWTPTS